jgi:hypothetical protein
LAIPPASAAAEPAGLADPVFGLIEAHRTAMAAYDVALAEHTRLDRLGDPAAYLISEAPFMAQLDVLNDLIGTAPATFAGLQAWASHLNEIRHVDEAWMFEEEAPTLVVTLVEALGNLAVTSRPDDRSRSPRTGRRVRSPSRRRRSALKGRGT